MKIELHQGGPSMGIFRKMKEKRDAKKKAELEECKKEFAEIHMPRILFRRAIRNAEEKGAPIIIDGVCYNWNGKVWISDKTPNAYHR